MYFEKEIHPWLGNVSQVVGSTRNFRIFTSASASALPGVLPALFSTQLSPIPAMLMYFNTVSLPWECYY